MSKKMYFIIMGFVAAVLVIPIYLFIWTNQISLTWFIVILIMCLGVSAILSVFSDYIRLIFGTNDEEEKSPPLNLTKKDSDTFYRTYDIKTNYSTFSNRSKNVDTSKPKIFNMSEKTNENT